MDSIALAQYDKLNLAVTRDTLSTFSDANVASSPTMLGSGAFNTTFSVRLCDHRGMECECVFKPLRPTETGWVARRTGIPHDNPQTAMRNIATLAYAEKLGFDVIAHTQVARLTVTQGLDPELGLLMDRARGKVASEAKLNLMAMPDVIREVTKLQLLDHLTGQGDRHSNNYFVDVDANNRVKVTGIDNDQCFGDRVVDPEAIRYSPGPETKGFRGTRLPPVVDHEMAIAITDLRPEDVRTMLENKLSRSEVEASVSRLERVKQHIVKLQERGCVINTDEWGRPEAQQLQNAENSYAKRDFDSRTQHPAPQQPAW